MIIKLTSSNPMFSFIIGKNPLGIPIVRSLREGSLIGWFPEKNDRKYIIYFHDSPDVCSFQQIQGVNEAKYVNVGQYSSPVIISSVINDILSNTIRKLDEKDLPHKQKIYFSGLRIKNIKLYQCIKDTFTDVNFNCKHLVGFMYELTLTSNGTLFDLMNIVSLMMILIALGNKETITLDNNCIEKFARHISNATTNKVEYDGWYLRYIFKKRAKLNKKQLSLLETPRLILTIGNSSDARADFIRDNIINYNNDFLDIGCGSDLLIRHIIHKKWELNSNERNYYLVDSDPSIQTINNNKGLLCYSSVDDFYNSNPTFNGYVIMTEVIEHNEENDAYLLLNTVLSNRPSKVFITTPNYDFNKFFNNSGSFRHDDHRWEMTFLQFKEWITNIITSENHNYRTKFIGIGDQIDNIPITSGAILTLN